MAIDVDIRTDVGVIFYLDRAFCDSIVQYFDSVNVTDNKNLKKKDGLPGLPNRDLLSVFEAVKNRKQI